MQYLTAISLWALILAGFCSCTQLPAVTPMTAKLYGEMGLDNANIQNVQFYYRAKKRHLDGDRTRDTFFRHSEAVEKKSVMVERKLTHQKETAASQEDIVLYNGTPCVVRNAEKTERKTYLLKVDFGDDILLDFENNRSDGVFYLSTNTIVLNEKTYTLGENLYGYLAVEADQGARKRTSRTIYEIRGKSIQ